MKIFKWIKRIILGLFLLSIAMVFIYKWVPVPVTELMLERYFLHDSKIEKKWVSLEDISNPMQLAVVSSEDQSFLDHSGFDFKEIQKAIEKDAEKVRGASTISQQTAKNVFLWGGRSYIRKGFEVYFTCLIEWVWGKKRIMEIYLNVIEFGDGIYGVESAAKHYFGKSASQLTKTESATLAALLPNPREYGKNINGRYIQKRKVWIMRQMSNLGGEISYP